MKVWRGNTPWIVSEEIISISITKTCSRVTQSAVQQMKCSSTDSPKHNTRHKCNFFQDGSVPVLLDNDKENARKELLHLLHLLLLLLLPQLLLFLLNHLTIEGAEVFTNKLIEISFLLGAGGDNGEGGGWKDFFGNFLFYFVFWFSGSVAALEGTNGVFHWTLREGQCNARPILAFFLLFRISLIFFVLSQSPFDKLS